MVSRAAIIGLGIGAALSLALMLNAGRNQNSIILIVVFAARVISPFLGILYAHLSPEQWFSSARRMLYALTVAVIFICPGIYATVAFGYTT